MYIETYYKVLFDKILNYELSTLKIFEATLFIYLILYAEVTLAHRGLILRENFG